MPSRHRAGFTIRESSHARRPQPPSGIATACPASNRYTVQKTAQTHLSCVGVNGRAIRKAFADLRERGVKHAPHRFSADATRGAVRGLSVVLPILRREPVASGAVSTARPAWQRPAPLWCSRRSVRAGTRRRRRLCERTGALPAGGKGRLRRRMTLSRPECAPAALRIDMPRPFSPKCAGNRP